MQSEAAAWRKCSSCKKPIGFNSRYYACSVSTCNGQRTGYAFCSVGCWEVHLPGARHKDAAAIEMKSPATAQLASSDPTSSSSDQPTRRIIASPSSSTLSATATSNQMPREILIIASRLKEYITARADMNTSSTVMEVLSDFVRLACDRAIDNARADGRKTVLDRDFKLFKNS